MVEMYCLELSFCKNTLNKYISQESVVVRTSHQLQNVSAMTNFVKHILVFAISVHLTFATKIGCGNDYVTANWDHDAFRYYFMPSNIEKTLYCIGFDKNRLTNDHTLSILNETGAFVHRNLLSFEYLNEEYNLLYFKEIFHFFIYNEQLHFNKSFH